MFSCLLCIIYTSEVWSQFRDLKFNHYSQKEGLSSSYVTSFAQTPDGYIWIGTSDGLNRFDGYDFKVFKHNHEDSTSLCGNHITTLFVDHLGVLWVGTETKGVSRYLSESQTFEHFMYLDYKTNSISNYFITSIIEDSNQQLWVGTIMGLNLFERETKTFKRYFHETSVLIEERMLTRLLRTKIPDQIVKGVAAINGAFFSNHQHFLHALKSHIPEDSVYKYADQIMKCASKQDHADHIKSLAADDRGNIWIGYQQDGLGYFNPNTNSLERYRSVVNSTNSLASDQVNTLLLTGDKLWIGLKTGEVNTLDIGTNQFETVPLPIKLDNVEVIIQDQDGAIWIADDQGLCKQDRSEGTFYFYRPDSRNHWSLSTNSVKSIFEDQQGNIWLGTAHGGVNLTTPNNSFILYRNNPAIANSLTKNSISSVLEDSKGNLWVGYFTNGLDYWDKSNNTVKHFAPDHSDPSALGKGTVFDIFEDSQKNIWVGSYEGGLQLFDDKRQNFITFKNDPNDPNSISGNDVRAIDEDDQNRLWLAIHGNGVNCFDKTTKTAVRYTANYLDWENSLANDWVYTLKIDATGNILVGSVWGLSVLNKGAKDFVSYNDENSTLSHNRVRSIHQDQSGNIWIGTESGLNRFTDKYPYFEVFTESDGLPNNNITSVLSGAEEQQLWIGTKNGISNFNYRNKNFRNYHDLGGRQSSEFFEEAIAQGKDHTMYFGSPNGLIAFQPSQIAYDSSEVSVLLSDVTLFDNSLLDSPQPSGDRMQLCHDQNMIGFEYVALHFERSERIEYAYKLEGSDTDWNYVGNTRHVTFKNLDPGDYDFYVKATNGLGHWSKPVLKYQFAIKPPFWLTYEAYVIYFTLIILLLYGYKRYLINKERHANELRLQDLKAQKKHEMDEMKIRFFSNISHEFRLPLSLIKGPLEKLIEEDKNMSPSLRMEYFQLINRNSRRLIRLIDQLLDISQLDAGQLKLKVGEYDIVEFSRNISDAFIYQADKQLVDFTFQSNKGACLVYFDPDKLEKILYNLLSNAFKSILDGGEISVHLDVEDSYSYEVPLTLRNKIDSRKLVKLTVKDNGVGIDPEHMPYLFDMFEHRSNGSKRQTGSGVGLSYVKQLVTIHKGEIDVISEPRKGATFVIWLPVDHKDYTEKDINLNSWDIDEKIKDIRTMVSPPVIESDDNNLEINEFKSLPTLLVIDDDDDLRRFIKLNLHNKFIIYEADNGVEGYTSVLHIKPDIILTDLMMPHMNGLEVCQKLKADKRTAHIPIVILSAKSSEADILKGLSTGADDYLIKPFSMRLLKSKVTNILGSRNKMKEKFFQEEQTTTIDDHQGKEKDFLTQLMHMIDNQLQHEYFGPDSLASYMSLSRSQLYKKVRGLTGLSVSILIRNTRLKKACKLLSHSDYTIAEVAYAVGFNDPGYFAKCFKEMYGKSPSDYISEQCQ